jgi:DNA invertase Pin-like site-specific DNA recombinase
LRCRAIEWGWPSERILVIDEDQGRSGSSAEGRLGFQRLLAEVSLDHVGLVLGIEMSRLARSCKDWYQLLEVCALFSALLADQEGIYDPREYNDRLLLGLKGTLSEAELHIIQQRMSQGRLNKARRGELFNHPPIGYVRLPTGQIALDPDEQVQSVVRLIFDQFDALGTINALLRYLVHHRIDLPIRPHQGVNRGQLEWHRPNRQTLRNLLHHPLYAGAYTWGRRLVDPRRKIPGRPGTGRTVVMADQCRVLLKDRCPAYITWSRYQAHQRQITDNEARGQSRGAVREGVALLKGLLVCGRCGCRMIVQYGWSRRPRYVCTRRAIEYGEPVCQSLSGREVEALVARQVLTVLQPAGLELSLSAAADIERQRTQMEQQWHHRLERAQYEADRAARQYHIVEPENRLVARQLERQWEQKLLEQRQLQEQYDRYQEEQPVTLSEADRSLIQTLAADIPRLWQAAETTPADRQTIVRHLIERVTITAPSETQQVDLAIQWAGGFASHHTLLRSVARYEQLDNYQGLMVHILDLRGRQQTSAQIAAQLNREGYRPPKRVPMFTADMVRMLFWRRGQAIKRPRVPASQAPGDQEWWLSDLVRHLQIPHPTLYSWIQRGWVHARQLPVAVGPWIIWADTEELDRLRRLHRCSRRWVNQPQAALLCQPKPKPGTS